MKNDERFAQNRVQGKKNLPEQSKAMGQALSKAAVEAYEAIEHGTVGAYKSIENGVVGAYRKTEAFFVEKFFTRPGESVEEARKRMQASGPK